MQTQTQITPLDPLLIEKAIILGTTPTQYDFGRSKAVKADSRLAIMFVLVTGRRRCEILRLRGQDLNLNDSPPTYWATLKGGRRQLFEIPPVKELLTGLRERQDREKVFQVTGEVMIKHLNDGLKQLGINKKMTIHDLRDIFALERLRKNEPAYKVSRLLGHTRLETTLKHYTPYIVTDYSSTLRNSSVIRHGLTIPEITDEIKKEVQMRTKDDRFQETRISMDQDGITIKIPYSEIGLEEMKTSRH